MTGIVYVYTEKATGKQYVGRTLHPTKRFTQHIHAGENKVFHQVIRQYNINNDVNLFLNYFEYTVLNEIEYNNDTKKEVSKQLDYLESKYIKEFNTLIPNGYNEQSYSVTTVKPLTDEQVKKAQQNYGKNTHSTIDKFINTKTKKHSIYYKYIETEEQRNKRIQHCKDAMYKRYNTPEALKAKEETKIRNQQKREQQLLDRAEYWNSEEGIERKKQNTDRLRQTMINYNKSEAHRQSAIQSNKTRWINGLPEDTHNKMVASQKLVQQRRKGQKWMNKDGVSKMIIPCDFEKYINDGWSFGRH